MSSDVSISLGKFWDGDHIVGRDPKLPCMIRPSGLPSQRCNLTLLTGDRCVPVRHWTLDFGCVVYLIGLWASGEPK